MRALIGLLAAAVLAGLAGPASADSWSDWSVADARRLAGDTSGTVTEITHGEDGDLIVYLMFDGWLNVAFFGHECSGSGDTQRCKSLGVNAVFDLDSAERAATLEHEMSYEYVADMADGASLILHRRIELAGGLPEANLRAQLEGFLDVCGLASQRAWPPKAGGGGGGRSSRLHPPG